MTGSLLRNFYYICIGMKKTGKVAVSAVFGIAVYLFWALRHPYLLGFQEQNQLFLYTWEYLADRLSVGGGFAAWLAEFLVQFCYIPALGAAGVSAIFTLLQILTWKCAETLGARDEWYPLSLIPASLLLVAMGDIYVMLTFGVALVAAQAVTLPCLAKGGRALPFAAVPILFWLVGPAAILVSLAVAIKEKGWASLIHVLYGAAAIAAMALFLMPQQPFGEAVLGVGYYRMPLHRTVMMGVTALGAWLVPFIAAKLPAAGKVAAVVQLAAVAACTVLGCSLSYDKDSCETIHLDQLVRNEDWDGVLSRADKYLPKSPVCCVCVNLALCLEGRMDEMDKYRQCGTEGLIMTRISDFISNTGTYEVFWRLGLVNSALRYAFDSQEAEVNNAKSGRHMMKIADCHIVNGNYAAASKYLDILSHSLFYAKDAERMKSFLDNEARIATDPVYGYLRQVRYEQDFIYNYNEMDTMLLMLYNSNRNNVMAAQYYKAWKKLETI